MTGHRIQTTDEIVPRAIILDADDLTDAEVRVWLILWAYADGNGESCFPSRDTIARHAGKSVGRVSAAITGLVDKGWLERRQAIGENGSWLANDYTVTTPTVSRIRVTRKRHTTPCPSNNPTPKSPRTRSSTPSQPSLDIELMESTFDEFWQAYPHRRKPAPRWSRKDTMTAWAAVPGEHRRATIEAAKAYAASRDVARDVILRPDRWLDREPWTSAPDRPGQVDDGWVVLDVPDFSRPAAQA